MGKSVRCISVDGTLFMTAIDATDIVNRAAEIHQTSAVTSAALGRLLCIFRVRAGIGWLNCKSFHISKHESCNKACCNM